LNDGYELVGLSDLAPTLHQPQQVNVSARSAVREIAKRRSIHGFLRWWPELSAGPSPIQLLVLRLNMSGIGVNGRQVKAQTWAQNPKPGHSGYRIRKTGLSDW